MILNRLKSFKLGVSWLEEICVDIPISVNRIAIVSKTSSPSSCSDMFCYFPDTAVAFIDFLLPFILTVCSELFLSPVTLKTGFCFCVWKEYKGKQYWRATKICLLKRFLRCFLPSASLIHVLLCYCVLVFKYKTCVLDSLNLFALRQLPGLCVFFSLLPSGI